MWALLAHKRKVENFQRKFDAQIHDKELEDNESAEESDIERIKREALAEINGMSVEEYTERKSFGEAGIGIELDGE